MSERRVTRFWCVKDSSPKAKVRYMHFYPRRELFITHSKKDRENLVRVEVIEAPEQTPESECYWAWWDNSRNRFDFVWYAKMLVEMCFPYGAEAAEKSGKGKLQRVLVKEVEREGA